MKFPLTALQFILVSQTVPLLFFTAQAETSAQTYQLEHSTFSPEYGGATSVEVFNPTAQENTTMKNYWLEHSTFNPQYGGATSIEFDMNYSTFDPKYGGATSEEVFNPYFQQDAATELYWLERSSFNPEYGGATSEEVFETNRTNASYQNRLSTFNPLYGGATTAEVFNANEAWKNPSNIQHKNSIDIIGGTRLLIPGIRTNYAEPRQTTSAQLENSNIIR